MTTENDFVPFAAAFDANVETQSEYLADAALGPGVITGLAKSALYNKVARQSSLIASVIAQYIVQQLGVNVIDDGTTATILSNLSKALNSTTNGSVGITSSTTVTIPEGVYYFRFKDVTGGGGGAGGSTGNSSGGSAGGGSPYADGGFAVNPGDVITFTIGTGGTGGVNANGAAGASTLIKLNSTTMIMVTGGGGGIWGNNAIANGASSGLPGSVSAGSDVSVSVRPAAQGMESVAIGGPIIQSGLGGAPGGAGFNNFSSVGVTSLLNGPTHYAYGGGGTAGVNGGNGGAGKQGHIAYWW